ncbi:hypothetical protein ENUP19_0278G0014 [Entamoeba nuttalli]|uniref:RNA methyltransferase, TrmH family protein, putative n=2 Tax=Entamoeba nuttalli TaxID=412467 RepID=K2H5Y4_ENTNP|nr:RNA methyltransferase, TrmH family protein, putative [Entamoeba nuttalli P19]EKE43018.1 RNA methyltransferase, TrmH family protein, putative [Entamoeba nuttalli P19]|eukprot:XP_008854646.1 RNA methyltransferase, TrmH family protein, putative [Entamoeba nuttalli P19]
MNIEKGKIYVGGFTNDFTEQDLRELFSEFGTIESISIFHKRITFAHIIFTDKQSCAKAIEKYEMKKVNGITLRVGEMKITPEKEKVQDERTFGDIKMSVILVRPMHEDNIGAVGRLCANYGINKLYIVNPLCEIGEESIKVSRHGNGYIENAVICKSLEEVRKDCTLLVGYTARESSGQKNKRILMTMQEAGDMLSTMKGCVGLVFGNESNGLNTEECDACDLLNKIDIRSHYPVLNLSHAVGIALNYMHMRLRDGGDLVPEGCKEIIAKEKGELLEEWKEILHSVMNEQREVGAVESMKKLLGRVMLTEREAAALDGAFKALLHHFHEKEVHTQEINNKKEDVIEQSQN